MPLGVGLLDRNLATPSLNRRPRRRRPRRAVAVAQLVEGIAPSASLRRVKMFMLMTTATISSIAGSSK